MRTEQVAVKRGSSNFTRVGPALIILPIEEAASKLARSAFMLPWIEQQIVEHLAGGGELRNVGDPTAEGWRGSPDGVISRYSLATQQEIEGFVSSGGYTEAVGRKLSAKTAEKSFTFDFKKNRTGLPKQAVVILSTLEKAANGSSKLSVAAIELAVNDASVVEALNTKQPPTRIWGFYRSRFKEEGFIILEE